jgi:DNA-3-methyladenine glycosylase I
VFLELQQQHGSFDAFVWGFVPNRQPIVNSWTELSQVPTK